MKLTSRSAHPAKKRGFFKIIVSEISPESKLMIPKEFVKNHKEKLRGRVHLKATGSAPWPVDVVRTKGEVWLQNGWPEFATFYSLSFGSVLVFESFKKSKFRVRVFDQSATEINYPLNRDLSLDDGESVPQVRKREAEIGGSSKKTRSSTEEAFHDELNLKQEEDGGSASKEEIERVVNLAAAFESENPFFVINIRPSYVIRSGVDVRRSFLETYTKWEKRGQVIFRVGNETWPIGYTLCGERCTLNTNWKKFLKDNSLEVDDVCVFELIDPARKLFNVIVYQPKREAA
ncbi:hypothetical protein DCAR_0729508 [Daucus carota subsp. sativus]|uniref:TF-B3 domain-containing protein n=1 Tax=Daucus carota subsp. sativus TaxID=79200 RepID=A0AAF0XN11_DAUCS|nr:hypothetical protein DCAR_0729508 [Daucus carota subsp. sativus]